ncbi:Ig-like domain-containing protein [Sulfurifustis variabilis]|nr:Ig-like domain-containing protein [Sulfurifustis variabilis]
MGEKYGRVESMNIRQTPKTEKKTIAAAVALALGAAGLPQAAHSTQYTFSWTGYFTMLTAQGNALVNTDYSGNSWAGSRTNITGTMTFDTATGQGSGTVVPFYFFNGGSAIAQSISLQAIGDGDPNTNPGVVDGTLILANMLFNWNGNNGIPVSIVLDGAGLFGVMPTDGSTLSVNQTITGVGTYAASEGLAQGAYPMGLLPVSTTTWNTTTVPGTTLGTNPSGVLPLIADNAFVTDYDGDPTTPGYQTACPADMVAGTKPAQVGWQCDLGVGGSPMQTSPFPNYNANFDIASITVTCVDGVCAPPGVQATNPPGNETNVPVGASITATFTAAMDASTVASGFSLVETGTGMAVPGVVTPSTGTTDTTFTFNPDTDLAYSTEYTATLGTTIQDAVGQTLSSAHTWNFTTQAPPVAAACADPSVVVPLGSNFTMLTPAGIPFGGTNDIEYDFGNGINNGINNGFLNTAANGTSGITTNILRSAAPHPFFGFPWTAHHVRLFAGPGTYTFDTTCTTTQLEAGVTACNNPVDTENGQTEASRYLTMTVAAGQIGAHMLFDWNGNDNIDVVNVWNLGTPWSHAPDGAKNDPWSGALWAGPAGLTVDPDTIYDYVSTDNDSDGNNGVAMVDGPFRGFNANFNLGPASSCVASILPPKSAPKTKLESGAMGCTLSKSPISPLERGDLWLIGGFIAWLAWVRRRMQRQSLH